MYKDLNKNISNFNLQIPNTIVPIPTELDYDNGFIRRYFIQKRNDDNGFIFEVSNEIFDNYIESPFWKTVDLKWRIKGSKIPIYKQDGSLEDTGVENSNKSAIALASTKLRNIPLYLPNLLQFHK
jgi:hypothetical protein